MTGADQRTAAAEPGEQPAGPTQIRNIRELFDALRAPHPATRVTALKAIQEQRQAALSFGVSEGVDVIDVLISQSRLLEGTAEWMQWLATLDCFDDSRVTRHFFDLLANDDDPLPLFVAARHLEQVAWASIPQGIEDVVLSDADPTRARAASRVLKNATRLTERASVRLGLLLPGEMRAARLDAGNSGAWLAELKGCFHAEAMAALQAQGEPAWVRLALLWEQLDPCAQAWLLRWGAAEFPFMLPGILPQALGGSERSVILEALLSISDVGASMVPAAVRSLASPFLSDHDPQLREAAVSAVPPHVDWREFLASEKCTAVRVALIRQLAKTQGEQAIPDLLHFLRTSDWQERSAVAECLIVLGRSAVDAVKPLVHDADENVRIAAVRVLLGLEQDSWLERELAR